MTRDRQSGANRFACRAILREALTANAALEPSIREHLAACSFCAARVHARRQLEPLLRQRPPMPAMGGLSDEVRERIVEHAENGPLGQLLGGALPVPAAAGIERDAWPEALLESRVARHSMAAVPEADHASWSRVKSSILDRVAGGAPARTRRHWWLGLLGTAAAAGIVLVLVQQDRTEPPTITFQDIVRLPSGASMPRVDFAVVRHGATR